MLKKIGFLIVIIFIFVPFTYVYASIHDNKESWFAIANIEKYFLTRASNVLGYSQDTNNLSEFSEFSDEEDKEQLENEIYDPLEYINRKVFTVNLWLDEKFMSTIEVVYCYVFPSFIRERFINFIF